jgi:putative FmdB family regulatory protein
MPTYEYECQRCKHTFEKFQGMTEPRLKTCPKCRGKVKRLLGTGAGVIFKGSGFYQTDYRSADYKKKAKAETGGESKPAGEAKSGGETKNSGPAVSKTETKPATTEKS